MKLSSKQQQDLDEGRPVEVDVEGRICILLTRQSFEQVANYDPNEWTDEEINLLADEAADLVGCDELDQGDD